MGEVFAGRYELVDPIGRGGVGAVWRAWDHRRRRYVAAKVLQQSDAHSLLRFVREQAVRIDHPHVLAPASWAADDDKVLFTMDLVGGGSLVHLIGDYGPLPSAFVCTLLDQLLAGLAAVHAEGIVHRDIKPANILLEATGTGRPRLRLSDFGISMRLGEPRLTETNYVVGTPGYVAPEQLLGADPDFPADLFAVGLVALYLLEGARPDAKALIEHFAAHGTPSAPKGIPEPLWQVVASLLQPDPQARFRTATGARKALVSARELLPEPGSDDELIEVFDQLGPLPAGFGPEGPLTSTKAAGRPWGNGDRQGVGEDGPQQTDGEEQGQRQGRGQIQGQDQREAGSRSTVPRRAGPNAPPPSPLPGTGADSPEVRSGTAPPEAPAHGSASSEVHADAVSPAGDYFPGRPPHDRPSPEPPTADPVPPRPPAASETGSFHLPPPPRTPTPPAPRELPGTAHSPSSPYEPTHAPFPLAPYPAAPAFPVPQHQPQPHLQSQPQPQPQRETASTASYTAQDIQVPSQPEPQPQQQSPSQAQAQTQSVARHRGRRARRRPGPPAAVTVLVLLLALVCFAIGFWALTRI
ncbi:protein kinase [Streptomyces sp. NPDC002701]|uniref:protein kinase domain-containing protein n=1 Tax=Streptomyces sp. NPDC002701 TaxID=3364661 RepID=UPI00368683AD